MQSVRSIYQLEKYQISILMYYWLVIKKQLLFICVSCNYVAHGQRNTSKYNKPFILLLLVAFLCVVLIVLNALGKGVFAFSQRGCYVEAKKSKSKYF